MNTSNVARPTAYFLLAVVAAGVPGCAPADELSLTYLGAAGWRITDGETVILVDPYLTRLKYGSPDSWDPRDPRPAATPGDTIAPDTAAILEHVADADYILVHHTHVDHAHDVPFIARRTGAVVIGTRSTARLLRAYGVPERQIRVVNGEGTFDLPDVRIRAIPGLHTDFGRGVPDPPPEIPEEIAAPVRLEQLVEGGSLVFEIRLGEATIVTMGSMNFREDALRGLRPEIAIVGAHTIRSNVLGYTRRLLRALGNPPTLLPTHWDNYRVPYGWDQSERYREQVRSFVEEVGEVSPDTRVVRPRHLETIRIRIAKNR